MEGFFSHREMYSFFTAGILIRAQRNTERATISKHSEAESREMNDEEDLIEQNS